MATLPTIVYAVYARRWRLLAATVVFTALDPVLFPPPENADAWMTRVVLAERYWLESCAEPGALDLLTVANVPVTLYALDAAYRRDVGGATVATALAVRLKLAFVAGLVRRFGDDLDDLERALEAAG